MKGDSDIKKRGYLKKIKNSRKRYFVLRLESDSGPKRLECYDNEKKFNQNGQPRRVISLADCGKITELTGSKHQHAMSLCTKDDESYGLYAESAEELETWLVALDEVKNGPKSVDSSERNENGWEVTVIDRGVGKSRRLAGAYRLQFLPANMQIARLKPGSTDSIVLDYASIRRCGHSDSYFFVETGRSSCTGPGELWMRVDDNDLAEAIHEKAIIAMRTSRGENSEPTRMEDADIKLNSKLKSRIRSSTMPSRPRRPTDIKEVPSVTTAELDDDEIMEEAAGKKVPKRFSFSSLFPHNRSKSASSIAGREADFRDRTRSVTKFDRPPDLTDSNVEESKSGNGGSDSNKTRSSNFSSSTPTLKQRSVDLLNSNLDPVAEGGAKETVRSQKSVDVNYVNIDPTKPSPKGKPRSDFVNTQVTNKSSPKSSDYMQMEGTKTVPSKPGDYVNFNPNANKSRDYVNFDPNQSKSTSRPSDYVNVEPGKSQGSTNISSSYMDMQKADQSRKTGDYMDMGSKRSNSSDYINVEGSKTSPSNATDYVNMEVKKSPHQVRGDYANTRAVKKSSSVGDYVDMTPGETGSSKQVIAGDYVTMQPTGSSNDSSNYVAMQPGKVSTGGDYVVMQPEKDVNSRPSDYIDIDYHKKSSSDYINMNPTVKSGNVNGRKEYVDYIETNTDSDARSRSSSDNNNGPGSRTSSNDLKSSGSGSSSYLGMSPGSDSIRSSSLKSERSNSQPMTRNTGRTNSNASSHPSESSSYMNVKSKPELVTGKSSTKDTKSVQYVDVEPDKKQKPSQSEKISGGRLSNARSRSSVAPLFKPRNTPMSSSAARQRKSTKTEESDYTEINLSKTDALSKTKGKSR